MRRLVYSPTVQAYIKADDGVFDISPYIVRGSVNRKVNQVSTAQITLRNPIQGESSKLLFTEFLGPKGSDPAHPMFHPMDPIIIVMQRLASHPVQVFTGYLDKAPYIQLFPGLCSIEASCTLKRLQYTQWDSSLPAVQTFLSQFGWEPDGSGVWNLSTQVGSQFTDGSIGALLFAILQKIGAWDKSTIWIESLPPEIQPIVSALYARIEVEVQESEQQFQSLLTQILGTGSFGSGAPATGGTGNVKNIGTIIPTMESIANQNGLPPLFVVSTWLAEGEVTGLTANSSGARGYFQFTSATPYGYFTTKPINYPQDAGDLGISTSLFCGAAAWVAKNGYSDTSGSIPAGLNVNDQAQWETWAETVQQPGAGAYSSYWGGKVQQAKSLLAQYGKNAPASSTGAANSSTAPAATAHTGFTGPPAPTMSGKSPGGKTGTTSGTGTGTGVSATASPLGNIFPYNTQGITIERTDMGVDFSAPDGIAVGAIASGTFHIACASCFFGQPFYSVVLDKPINGYGAWYIAEGVGNPIADGTRVAAGQRICDTQSHTTGIETGWATSDGLNAAAHTHYSDPPDGNTAEGVNFAGYIGVPVLSTNSPKQALDWSKLTPGANTGATGGASGGSAGGGTNSNLAAAFSTMLELPGIFNQAEAEILKGKRSFIADQPLFPFIQQVCQASMRNFMSMPNGNFFAFFPDYFGLFGRKYYWQIQDIEIMDGRIDLSDDPLLTHMGVAGDTTAPPSGQVQFSDLIMTAGIFDIFDAIATGYVGGQAISVKNLQPPTGSTVQSPTGGAGHRGLGVQDTTTTPVGYSGVNKDAAVAFLQKYGARPFLEEVPAIRSPIYELFLAFQNFMIAWSKQFQTPFELTFMPELFPGGLVAFPNHHFQVYVEEVVHSFDYQSGFTTTANFSSPSAIPGDPQSSPTLSQGNARPAALQPAKTT